MKLIATMKLLPTATQSTALLATMEKFNEACNWLAGKAFEIQCASQYDLHALHYRELRLSFGLSAQMAVRCIGKVIEVYKRDKSILPKFKPHGAIPYDQRILTFKEDDRVSILTLAGRETLSYTAGDYHRKRLEGERGQSDLILRKGRCKSRDEFVCKSCGFTDHADHVGAVNIGRRAIINWPIVSSRETGIPRRPSGTPRSLETSLTR